MRSRCSRTRLRISEFKIWRKPWYIGVVIVVPIAFVAHRFSAQGIYSFKSDGTLEVGYADKQFEKFSLGLTTLMYGSNMGIHAILSSLTVYKYFKLRETLSSIPAEMSIKLISKL